MNEKVLLNKIECLLNNEREYITDLRDEYFYYKDDLEDEVVCTYGIKGRVVA
ncbi:MAG: hypothetical protein ACI3T9_00370 [Romboutsia timonensis]